MGKLIDEICEAHEASKSSIDACYPCHQHRAVLIAEVKRLQGVVYEVGELPRYKAQVVRGGALSVPAELVVLDSDFRTIINKGVSDG